MFSRSKLRERNRHDELMDQPGLSEADHFEALRALRRVNLVSGSSTRLWPSIERLAQKRSMDRPLRVLDVACGGGDIALNLAQKAKETKLPVVVHGCDISMQAINFATLQAESRELNSDFFQRDALADSLPDGYDILTCTLFLHHLEPADATTLLRNLGIMARELVMVDDLIRSRLGYVLALVGCHILSRSHIVHYDGPVSVQGAYTMTEALQLAHSAGLAGATIESHWPERFLLTWSRSG